jgi:hypothetical protein
MTQLVQAVVVVPAQNEMEQLPRCLSGLAAAQCYRSQIQVADADPAPLLPSFVVRRPLAVREVAF